MLRGRGTVLHLYRLRPVFYFVVSFLPLYRHTTLFVILPLFDDAKVKEEKDTDDNGCYKINNYRYIIHLVSTVTYGCYINVTRVILFPDIRSGLYCIRL